jgi:YegS/Rv2252/BmrU family lipid kinase
MSLPNRFVRAALIYNPAAGTSNVQQAIPNVLRHLESYGWNTDLLPTARPGDVYRLALQVRKQGKDILLVAGGDGSLNEAVNALAYSPVALGVLPTGTGNVFARQIKLPTPPPWSTDRLVDAASQLAMGQVRLIDLGQVGEHYFLQWSGIGLDAEVAASIEPKPAYIRRLGMLGYGAYVVSVGLRYRGTPMIVQIDGKKIRSRSIMVVISNGPLYAAFMRAAPNAILDDGLLDVSVFRGVNLLSSLDLAFNLIFGRIQTNPQAILRQGKNISIRSRKPCAVHVDGEPLTHTPTTITVAPCALRILVPQHVPGSLFMNSQMLKSV